MATYQLRVGLTAANVGTIFIDSQRTLDLNRQFTESSTMYVPAADTTAVRVCDSQQSLTAIADNPAANEARYLQPVLALVPYTATLARPVTRRSDGGFELVDQTPYTARVYNSGGHSVGSGGQTTLTFNTQRSPISSGMHSTSVNPSRLIAPVTAWYAIKGHVGFSSNGTGYRRTFLKLNGATFIAIQDGFGRSDGETYLTVATEWRLTAGEYVEFQVEQNSGVTLNTIAASAFSPEFSMTRLVGS